MSFWTDQDVLQYIIEFNIDFAEIYGAAIFDGEKYFVTGEPRTGCMFCMYGIQYDVHPNKFQRMKITHPSKYDYCIRPIEENGLGEGLVLDYMGVDYK
jgi:3'-phosphoadenosine 5'-phosphosulfate sulfotransferase (PAPS reductase)/FAD synthetase